MTLKEEKQLRHIIREMVDEYMLHNSNFKTESSDDNSDSEKSQDRDGKPGRESDATVGNLANKRKTVLKYFKNKYIDCAPFAYELWPKKDKASARSLFYKKRDGETNDEGYPYSFDDEEIVTLYNKIANDNI